MRLEIQCEDRVGMIHEILDIFMPYQIDVRFIEIDSTARCVYCGFSDLPFSKLQILLAEIRRLDSVEDVKTVMFTPFEREHNGLHTLLESLPDGVIAVDIKGKVTMVTEKAAMDLNASIDSLLYQPLSNVIKGVNFAKEVLKRSQNRVVKRVKLGGKTLLLEMKAIYVEGEKQVNTLAGMVVSIKLEPRSSFRHSERLIIKETSHSLQSYFPADTVRSKTMSHLIENAQALLETPLPLLLEGKVATGKKDFIARAFQYWCDKHTDSTSKLHVCQAGEMTHSKMADWLNLSGWLVIDGIEHLDVNMQTLLFEYLTKQQDSIDKRDQRIISLTSSSQAELLEQGFHESLYFSLSCLSLKMPMLKERREDIEGAIHDIVARLAEEQALPIPRLSKEAIVKCEQYDWLGNFFELHNVCLQTLLLTSEGRWQASHIELPEAEDNVLEMILVNDSLEQTIKRWEADLLRKLYPLHPSTRRLAKAVGLSHSAIANKLKEYGIS